MSGKILVIGATGTVGAPLVAELLARGERVKAASRSVNPKLETGAETALLDLANPATLEAALVDVDRIYAVEPTGSTDSMATLAPVVEAAAQRGIKVVLQSAMGVDADDAIPMRQVELLLEKSGAPYVILRPNWFVDNFASYWASGVQAGDVRLPAAESRTSFIDAGDIAAAAAAALMTNTHDGKAFELTGPEAHTYAEALDLLSEATGRKITYSPVDIATFVDEAVAGGLPRDYAEAMAEIFHAVREGWAANVTDSVEILTGQPARSLKSAITKLVSKL